DIYG
ncbi:unnamed protein product, partial [Leptidea sinapis]